MPLKPVSNKALMWMCFNSTLCELIVDNMIGNGKSTWLNLHRLCMIAFPHFVCYIFIFIIFIFSVYKIEVGIEIPK